MLTLEKVVVRLPAMELSGDFSIEQPGITAIIGPSGGGKSTLLSVIAGFILPDEGRVLWQDVDLAPKSPGERPVAILFQDNNLFPHLDVLTNVVLGLAPVGSPSRSDLERANEALERVGLAGMGARKPSSLSGGQQSRVALARTLVTDRQVVLLDEAFSALGPALRQEMIGRVKELLGHAIVLMVTHDPEDARRWAHSTIFVDNGTVHSPVPTEDLFRAPPESLRTYLT
jgi:thiamine transport system ATP-binding protein